MANSWLAEYIPVSSHIYILAFQFDMLAKVVSDSQYQEQVHCYQYIYIIICDVLHYGRYHGKTYHGYKYQNLSN